MHIVFSKNVPRTTPMWCTGVFSGAFSVCVKYASLGTDKIYIYMQGGITLPPVGEDLLNNRMSMDAQFGFSAFNGPYLAYAYQQRR